MKTKFILSILFCITFSVAQIPQWFSTHNHTKYPNAEYILGVGTGGGTTGADAAKKAALADIVSQLRVQIQSEMKSMTESYQMNNDEQIYSDFKRQSRTVVSDEITGAEVIETVTDPEGGTTYALVVLNRLKYSAGLKTELETGWKQASELRVQAKEFISKGKLIEAIQSVQQVRQVIAPLFAKQVLHNAAAHAPFVSPLVFDPNALQVDIRSFLSQVRIEKKSGDKQKGKIGEKFAEPFVVHVSIVDGGKTTVCEGLPVSFWLDERTQLGETNTDAQGNASFGTTVRAASSDGIRAKISVPGLGREFEQNINSSSVSFLWTALGSDKTFSLSVNAKNAKVAESVKSKLALAVTQVGYKVVPTSKYALTVDVDYGTPNKIEGMAGTLYNITLEATITLMDSKTNTIIGSSKFTSKGVGKSEDEAVEKASNNIQFNQKEISALLEK